MIKLAVLDFETTGLDAQTDEVLQAAVIDENGNVLMNEYFCPQRTVQWAAAQKVNGISPDDVCGCAPFESAAQRLCDLLMQAETVIAYNDSFERSFLDAYGIPSQELSWGEDPMLSFAAQTGGTKRTLSVAAAFFGYEFDAHDALNDVRATLYLYNRVKNGGLLRGILENGVPSQCLTPNGTYAYKTLAPDDILRVQKCLGLAPMSAVQPRMLKYKGIYSAQPLTCSCTGFQNRAAADWLVLALEADGMTYLVCDDYLREMQAASFGADSARGESGKAPAAKSAAAKSAGTKTPAAHKTSSGSRYASFAKKSAALKNIKTNENADPTHPLFGKSIVFTGDLSVAREDAAAAAAACGAQIKSAVSGKTDYLVVGAQEPGLVGADGRSGKQAKAAALNEAGKAHICILDEEGFNRLVHGTGE